ncbi:MAG: alpha/beta hydrolase [Planctomycetia bacterium]|nr:alpha/beta hydrolase [Planctomycetia bacterium]
MSRVWFSLALTLALTLTLSAQGAEPVKLWPGKAPGETKDIGPEKYLETKKGQLEVKRLTNVTEPTITIYAPPKDKANGTAVIVAPGGGYNILAIEHEGTDVCEWLNKLGVTAVLLKYRVPRRAMQMPENLAMIQDAQRAVSLVRGMQKELGIDPTRVGMLGFSAGGNLTAWACLTKKRMYDKIDKTDEVFSHEPNFGILVYPGGIIDKEGKLKPEFVVKQDSPPMFFAHSSDDGVSSENSVALYMALKKVKVPVEMHLYASGGHGYGMRKIPHPCASWPDRAGDWMKARGLLDKPKSPVGEDKK